MAVHCPEMVDTWVAQDPQQSAESLSLSATASLRSLDSRQRREPSSPCGSEHCIAAAAISLNALRVLAGSERVLEVLCSSAQNLLSQEAESESEMELTTPLRGASLWQEASALVKATCSEKVYEFLTLVQRESEQLSYFLPAYLRLSTMVLKSHEIQHFLQFLIQNCWVPKIKHLLSKEVGGEQKVSSIRQEKQGLGWGQCVQLLCAIHLVQSAHACVCTHVDENLKSSLASVCEEWLCRGVLSMELGPLASSTPHLLYTAYQRWLEEDQSRLGGSAIPATTQLHSGLILRTCDLLCCALTLLLATASFDESILLGSSVETVLRLGNHYHEQLVQVAKLVPQRAPVKLWYVVLNTGLHLHMQLSCWQSNPALHHMTRPHHELYTQLIFRIGEFCDALRQRISSYHSNLCLTTILHDPKSHDWQNEKAFFEGERVSFSVQMWHYHLRGLQHDLWTICPGSVACKILSSVTASSVGHLAERYSRARPTYSRVPQFRADILAILISTASLLPYLSTFSNRASPEVAKVHQGCSLLLTSLALISSPLEQLQSSLSSHEFLGRSREEETPLGRWMGFVPLSQFGILPIPQSPSSPRCGDTMSLMSDFQSLVSLPYAKWDLLLKILLSGNMSFAASLCQYPSDSSSAAVTNNLSLVLAHCYQRPEALSSLHYRLGTRYISKRSNAIKPNASLEFLFQLLKEALQCYVALLVTTVSSKALQSASICCHPPRDFGGVLVQFVEGLENQLAQLPKPVLNLLWGLSESDDCSTLSGQKLAKIVGTLINSWLAVPDSLRSHLHPPVLAAMENSFCLIKHTLLSAGGPTGRELSSLSEEWLQAWQRQSPRVRQAVERLGSKLLQDISRSEVVRTGGEERDAEDEVVASILTANSKVVQSLEFLYSFLKANKDSIFSLISSSSPPLSLHLPTGHPTPQSEAFNPQSACLLLGNRPFEHQRLMEASDIDWKGLLEGFALDWGHLFAGREGLKDIVERRFELGQAARLLDQEAELVEAITTQLQ